MGSSEGPHDRFWGGAAQQAGGSGVHVPQLPTVLSESTHSFTITVTCEAGKNDKTVQTTLKFTYSEQ